MNRFQICGLPRSGTAFLATMFNLHDGVFCFHELAAKDPNWRKTRDELTGYEYVGDSSTYGFLPGNEWKGAVRIAISRNVDECVRSSEIAFGFKLDSEVFKDFSEKLYKWVLNAEGNAQHIIFEHVFDIIFLRSMFNACCPGAKFNGRKVEHLLQMNVQRQDKHLFTAEAARNIFNG